MTVAFACAAMLVSYLPFSAVNGVLGTIGAATGASTGDLQWVTDAFTVALVGAVLSAGVLGDLYGRKRIALAGLARLARRDASPSPIRPSVPTNQGDSMTSTQTHTSTYTLSIAEAGPVEVTLTERGQGHPFLILHGGGGPQTVTGFADLLADAENARVSTPTHPGFGGTPRPAELASVRGLAALYAALLTELDLADVTVVGNSIGGWIAAEMALLGSPRISSFILVDAVGIEVPGHPVADFFSLTMDQVAQLSYYDPAKFRIDLDALPPAAQAVMAGNRATLAVYSGPSMTDPGLAARLADVTAPALVLWGEADQIVDPDYGRAFAAAIPGAQFRLLTAAGHMPQFETPDQLLRSVWDFADAHATNPAR